MADRWFYAHDGARLGPFSGRQLHDLASAGEILKTDTIWKEGVERGALAARVKNLFHESPEAAAVGVGTPKALVAATLAPETTSAAPADPGSEPPAEIEAIHSEPGGRTGVAQPPPAEMLPIPDNIELEPEGQAALVPDRPAPPKKPVKKGRAVGVKGAVIVSQDGTNAKYKHKCSVCTYEDSTWRTIRITTGMVRSVFYCPKCSKKREVEIRCMLH